MNDDLRNRIIVALNKSQYRWRTARGVAKEIGEKEQDVFDTMRKSDAFVRAKTPNKNGEVLYTTAERYKKDTPFFERLLGAGANTVSS